jgi:hypothetical protein
MIQSLIFSLSKGERPELRKASSAVAGYSWANSLRFAAILRCRLLQAMFPSGSV